MQGSYLDKALKYWDKLTEKLMVENAQLEPMVTLTVDENWITFKLRYVVDYKKRRGTKDIISRKVLEAVKNTNGKIKIACTSSEVTLVK